MRLLLTDAACACWKALAYLILGDETISNDRGSNVGLVNRDRGFKDGGNRSAIGGCGSFAVGQGSGIGASVGGFYPISSGLGLFVDGRVDRLSLNARGDILDTSRTGMLSCDPH